MIFPAINQCNGWSDSGDWNCESDFSKWSRQLDKHDRIDCRGIATGTLALIEDLR
jgi:hypothetical protein